MKTLNAAQIKNLKDLINNNPQFSTNGSKLGDFFNLYLVCEALARKLVRYHYKKDKKELFLNNIKTAFKAYFPSKVNSVNIDKIFKGDKGKKGQKSCRQLRNGYIHSLSNGDKQEVETRYTELEGYMKDWRTIFAQL